VWEWLRAVHESARFVCEVATVTVVPQELHTTCPLPLAQLVSPPRTELDASRLRSGTWTSPLKQLRATLFNVANDYDTKDVGVGAGVGAPGTCAGGRDGAPVSKTRDLTRLTRGFGQANNDWYVDM
jgi:hypothetical protein